MTWCSRTGGFGKPNYIAALDPPVETYGKGRVCGHGGCGTILSEYNPDDYCGLHTDEQYTSLEHECTKEGMWVCPACGREKPPDFRHWRADPRAKDGRYAVCKRCERDT